MRDRTILYVAGFLRALATGLVGVLLGIYLARLHLSPVQIGVIISGGLAGGAAATLLSTIAGDRMGRRRLLIGLSVLSVAGGLVVAVASTPLFLGLAAFVGMVNGMGRDRGANLVLEQAILPATVSDQDRTRAFAWYNVAQDVGHASGSLLAGLSGVFQNVGGLEQVPSLRATLGVYCLLLLLPVLLYLRLGSVSEVATNRQKTPVTPGTRRTLSRISALFALDSVAGGFLTTALLAFFFFERFGASTEVIGLLFFCARSLNALSHLGAAWLARRIGLVNTMVFTHVPSSLLLITVAFAPNFPVAATLFLLREGLVEMDVPTRQSYVMAVVKAEERTLASGVTHLVRQAGWAVTPVVAGLSMETLTLGTPLIVGAVMKIAYDVLLYRSFKHLKPPEEIVESSSTSTT